MHVGVWKHEPAVDEQNSTVATLGAIVDGLLDGHAVAAYLTETTKENNTNWLRH